jgi:hypothetical protein
MRFKDSRPTTEVRAVRPVSGMLWNVRWDDNQASRGHVSLRRVLAAKEADLVKNPAKLGVAIAKMQTFVTAGSYIVAFTASPVAYTIVVCGVDGHLPLSIVLQPWRIKL